MLFYVHILSYKNFKSALHGIRQHSATEGFQKKNILQVINQLHTTR